jgi:hypothetical protein
MNALLKEVVSIVSIGNVTSGVTLIPSLISLCVIDRPRVDNAVSETVSWTSEIGIVGDWPARISNRVNQKGNSALLIARLATEDRS